MKMTYAIGLLKAVFTLQSMILDRSKLATKCRALALGWTTAVHSGRG